MAGRSSSERGEPYTIAFVRSTGVEDTLPIELLVSVGRAHNLLLAQLAEILKPLELGVSRFLALGVVAASGEGCRLSDLGLAIQVHPATVTMLVDQLVKQGLVRRVPHSTDRRSTLAVITPEGDALIRECFAAMQRAGFGAPTFDREKQVALVGLLDDLRSELDDDWPHDTGDRADPAGR
jgi:DNA-binding MarR family transcriptional regulator